MGSQTRLRAGLRAPLPAALQPGGASALFVHGWALGPEGPARRLELTVDGAPNRVLAERMPSPGLAGKVGGSAAARSCIFWGVAKLPARRPGDKVSIGLRGRVPGGEAHAELGEVPVAEAPAPASAPAQVAVCMATHEPPAALLREQLESLRAQTHTDWVCVISDDASSAAAFCELERLTAGDPRFVISRSDRRLGAYANFGRALAMAPPEARYVALCDQDDRWHPEKLEALLAARGSAALVFSDMRIVDHDGQVISPTYWTDRVPNHERLGSLLLGNAVTGAASLFERRLLDHALPLPPRAGNLYHDHWLALVAAVTGGIAYVPRALYDYVQHADSVVGHAAANRGVVGGGVVRRAWALRGRRRGRLRGSWREIYFGEYARLRLSAAALRARLGDRLDRRERRALRRVEAGAWSIPWLSLRQVRRLWRDETQGAEAAMLRALTWELVMRARRRHPGPLDDTDSPAAQEPSAISAAR